MPKKLASKKSSQLGKTKSLKPRQSDDVGDKKKNTSLRLDRQTLKALKIKAIEQDTSIQNLIETLIKNYLTKG